MPGEPEIEALLSRAPVGYLATAIGEQPFLHPSLFWYDPPRRRIYFHTAREGRTHDNVVANPCVAFSVAELGRLLLAKTALNFSNEYASVCLFGQARVVESDEERHHGLQGLLDKYFPDLRPGEDYRAITDDEMAQTAVYAVEIEGWSGKQKVAPG